MIVISSLTQSTDVVIEERSRGSNQVDGSRNEGGREPITAPARAGEDLDLDIGSSAVSQVDRAEEKRRRKEARRKARRERRRRRKDLEKLWRANNRRRNRGNAGGRRGPVTVQVTTPRPSVGRRRPSRKLTALELGPNYGLVTASSPSLPASWSASTSSSGRVVISRSEHDGHMTRGGVYRGNQAARGRAMTRYDPDGGKDTPIWLMDELLNQNAERRRPVQRRRRRRHNRQNHRGRYRDGPSGGSSKKPTVTISVRSYPTSSRLPDTSSTKHSRYYPTSSRLPDTSSTKHSRYYPTSSRLPDTSSTKHSRYYPTSSRLPDTSSTKHSRYYPTSSRLPDTSSTKHSRYEHNQHYRPRDSPHTGGSSSQTSGDLVDSPSVAGAPMKKPYYDKLHLFNILEDQKETKL